jgi:hypothetical protein
METEMAAAHTVGIVAMQDDRKPVWKRSYGQTAGVSITSSLDASILRGHVTATGVISTTHDAPFSIGNDGCRVMRQARWQVAHVHLCKIGVSGLIARPLLLAVALFVLGLGGAVVAPVVGMTLRPRLLRGALVDPVVGTGLELGPLPLALAGALAVGRGAEGLVGNLGRGSKGFPQQAQRRVIVVVSMRKGAGNRDGTAAAPACGVLYRLSISEQRGQFLLKGALLFDLWFDVPHRPTHDADLLGFGSTEIPHLEKLFREVSQIASDNGIVFQADSVRAAEIRKEAQTIAQLAETG